MSTLPIESKMQALLSESYASEKEAMADYKKGCAEALKLAEEFIKKAKAIKAITKELEKETEALYQLASDGMEGADFVAVQKRLFDYGIETDGLDAIQGEASNAFQSLGNLLDRGVKNVVYFFDRYYMHMEAAKQDLEKDIASLK